MTTIILWTTILWTSSITLPFPCVDYSHSLDKQHYSPLAQCYIQSFSGQAVLLSPYPVLTTIILLTSSITLPLPSVIYNHSLDKQYYSPLTQRCIQSFSGQAVLLSPYPVLYTIILWTSSITLPLPCVDYSHSLDKQHYSPLTQCYIQSFSGQAVLLSPYPVLYTIILWTSSITLPLPSVVYNHSLDKQHYSPLTQCCIQSFSGQAALLSPYPVLYTIILRTSSTTLPLPSVVYNHSLDKQYYSPLTQCCIQSFSGQAVLLSPYPVLTTIILWTSSTTLPLPRVVYNHSLDKQYYSPLTQCCIQSFSGQAV